MALLNLDPENAALSIARRLESIEQCERYVMETMKRYDDLKSFNAELGKHGPKVAERAAAILAKGR